MGQNACSGVQPALVAILVAQVQKIEVWTNMTFLVEFVVYVVIASIGTAGVGGGATNVSRMVLSMLGLPINLVGVLISIDFLIDMGRTMINVNDSIVAGLFVSRIEKTIEDEIVSGRKLLAEEQNAQPLLGDVSAVDTQPALPYTEGSPGGACCLVGT
jgi:L-cystine uptake protein TcyP (sodium:dicarboxylate symporter family)